MIRRVPPIAVVKGTGFASRIAPSGFLFSTEADLQAAQWRVAQLERELEEARDPAATPDRAQRELEQALIIRYGSLGRVPVLRNAPSSTRLVRPLVPGGRMSWKPPKSSVP